MVSNRFNARVFILIQLYVAVWLLFVTNLTQWFTISLPLSSFPSPPRFSSRSPTLSCFSSSSVPQTQYNTGTDLVIYERIYILRFFFAMHDLLLCLHSIIFSIHSSSTWLDSANRLLSCSSPGTCFHGNTFVDRIGQSHPPVKISGNECG